MITKEKAKESLDSIIKKSRVHMYKPIQIAEILYHDRKFGDVDINDLESYRNKSKGWRDCMCLPLLGRICTSTAKFQDNLFEDNAIPPLVLSVLSKENKKTGGAVEAYIYNCFTRRHGQLSKALEYCEKCDPSNFSVKNFIDSFWKERGLKRSIDKVYEIIVYALFSTLVDALKFKVEVSVSEKSLPILLEFEDFSKKILCIDSHNMTHVHGARLYRVGVTNAADRGLDMYSNWGPAIQIKHLTLDIQLAESIVTSVSSDKIVIVCKDIEKDVIVSLLTQIGWKSHIQSVVTENDLIQWYEKALRGRYADILATNLLVTLGEEIGNEFPSVDEIPEVLKERNYDKVKDSFWC